MEKLWQQLAENITTTIEQMLESRLRRFMERFCRSEVKICFNEKEAAEQLKISAATLAAWRKAGLIAYSRYPRAKSDELSDMYTYDLADLMNFRARYHVAAAGAKNVYEIERKLTVVGMEVRRAA